MPNAGPSRGALTLVGTPIGNLDDLSPRAAAALGDADVIACEDTRRTGRLLAHLGLAPRRLLVANEHTERTVAGEITELVRDGQRVVFVSDAGMPAISDPGEVVVAAMIEAGLDVQVIPGPSALDTAIALSGLATGRFCFEGFLPRKGSSRTERLEAITGEARTVVLYEAPHRLLRTLADLRDVCGDDRRIAVLRELTKLHEEHWRGTLGSASVDFAEREPRGEYVLVLAGAPPAPEASDETILGALAAERDRGATTRDAVDAVAQSFDVPRRRVYALAIEPRG